MPRDVAFFNLFRCREQVPNCDDCLLKRSPEDQRNGNFYSQIIMGTTHGTFLRSDQITTSEALKSLRSPEESLLVKLRLSRIVYVARYFSPLILSAHFKYIQGSDSPYRLSLSQEILKLWSPTKHRTTWEGIIIPDPRSREKRKRSDSPLWK